VRARLLDGLSLQKLSSPPSLTPGWWWSVPERLGIKKTIFTDLDSLAPQDAILASNSSSYPSSQIIERVTKPSRVVNTHYYMPPEQIAVEVMSCGKTSDAVIADLMERLPLYGVVPFHVRKESVGFIFNRIWAAVKRESLEVVEEGVSTPAEVDHIFEILLGTHGGPFRLMDKVGLDVVLDIEEHYAAIRPDLSAGSRKLLKQYIKEGRLGLKTGKEFYTDYEQRRLPWRERCAEVRQHATCSITRRAPSSEQYILHRLKGFESPMSLEDSDSTVAHTAFRISSKTKNEPLTSRFE
jgi:3-hydroxyacyl-CoA dehydrogenase